MRESNHRPYRLAAPITRFMLIGEVTAVGKKDTQILRYDLTITPRININSLQSVLIILKTS